MSLKKIINNLKVRYFLSKMLFQCKLSRKNFSFSYETNIANNKKVFLVRLHTLSERDLNPVCFCGISEDLNISLNKAFSEFLEAQLFYELGYDWKVSRSGFASHNNLIQAEELARHELLERDSLLMHILAPNLKVFSVDRNRQDIYSVQLQCMDPKLIVILSGHKNQKGFWTLGMGSSRIDKDLAVQKSIFECLMLEPEEWLDEQTILNGRSAIYRQHYLASLNNESLEKIFSLHGSISATKITPNFHTKNIKAFSPSNYVVQVVSEDLLRIQFGDLWMASEATLSSILSRRNLNIHNFSLHPFL